MKMTAKKLTEMLADGRGMGMGDKYQPWEQITRRRASPFSNLNLIPVPHLMRLAHFLSRGEREFGLLLWWLGAEDVREQYPLWPWPHRQPLDQIRLEASDMKPHPGMVSVARDAGIRLSNYPGLAVPAVLSIDFIATVPPTVGVSRLVGFSCKPLALFLSAASTDRLRERLELDRRYCVAANIPHHLVHPEQICRTLVVQLHWLAPIEPWAQLKSFVDSERYQTYLEHLRDMAYEIPACDASRQAGAAVEWCEGEDQRALKIAIWYQHLDVDLSRPLSMTRSLRPGGVALKTQFQKKWLGRPS